MRGLKQDLSNELKDRVIDHRARFVRIFYNRYLEMLPYLIVYNNIESLGIDFLKVEFALMNNYDVVIGKATNGIIQVLGLSKNRKNSENPSDLWGFSLLNKEDIDFLVPDHLIPESIKEITYEDNCKTGNVVVLRNKTLNFVSDVEIIEHYTSELAEVVLSRYSLTMQSKILTFFKGDENDQSINNLVVDLYNGSPFVKAGKFFDPDENIITLEGNANISSNFAELKREYQNKISELNNMLGINSLAVDKESGVSDTEAKSNRSFITSVANIKLESRKHAIDKLNKRFGLNIEVLYNDQLVSELQKEGVEEDENNNHPS